MRLLSSLTNRIFLATATLAVLLTSVAIYIVNRAVSTQAQSEMQRGMEEAGALVDEYRQFEFNMFGLVARLIADLPVIKAAVATHDPNTVTPIAEDYHNQLANNADLLAIADDGGALLARVGTSQAPDEALSAAMFTTRTTEAEREAFWPEPGGVLLIKSVPIWTDKPQPDGTLILGTSLDMKQASRFKARTNSEIAFALNGVVRVATLPEPTWSSLAPLLARPGSTSQVTLNGEDYLAFVKPLGARGSTGQAMIVILRSKTERLLFLRQLHAELALTAFVAVLAATLLSYAIARTVTRPVETITSTMREMAASGDLSRRIPVAAEGRWQDEDARVLATTFNAMTDSIARFQHEAAQRERLSSLGRLSTIVAHEIRNPLMIIKTSLRSLRRPDAAAEQVQAAARDIDEEISRLNRIVSEVLDFARPIRFDLGATDLNGLVEDAVRAAGATAPHVPVRVDIDRTIPTVVTDAGRLRQTLINVIGNAIQAMEGPETTGPDGERRAAKPGAPIRVETTHLDDRRFVVVVSDKGSGIAPEDLPRIFDPFFTTRRTGTGIGLAISRNIIEGLGGRITVASTRDRGTDVRIELPLDSRKA
jgi:signal transduction histidine kinase